jgi:hypothetical protein
MEGCEHNMVFKKMNNLQGKGVITYCFRLSCGLACINFGYKKTMNFSGNINWKECSVSCIKMIDHEILSDKKSSQWKFRIADVPMRNTAATNVRIADKLNMGAPQSVSM